WRCAAAEGQEPTGDVRRAAGRCFGASQARQTGVGAGPAARDIAAVEGGAAGGGGGREGQRGAGPRGGAFGAGREGGSGSGGHAAQGRKEGSEGSSCAGTGEAVQLPGQKAEAHALPQVSEEGIPDSQRGDRGGVPALRQGQDGEDRDELEAAGR